MSSFIENEGFISPENIIVPSSELLPISEQKEKVRDVPVTLIIPPSSFLADERVFAFLGILKVGAELEKNGNPIDVLDLSGFQNYIDIVSDYVASHENTTYGITATTPQIPAAAQIAQAIRSSQPSSKIILGGPHATLTHTAFKGDQKANMFRRGTDAFQQLTGLFDTIVSGDGEESIFYAIDPTNEKTVIDAAERESSLFLGRGTLEQYQFPARHLIDLESYKYHIDGSRATSVISQLGCPFECGFCGGRHTDFLRMARTRNISKSVIVEIEEVIRSSQNWEEPLRGIMFYDDELNVSTGGLETLCKELIGLQERLGFPMKFRGFIKAERFNEEQAKLMAQAGFSVVLSGVESGSDNMLTTMRKHTSRAINSRCVELAHNAGLHFKALMSIGHPGESTETIADSVEWALSNLNDGDDIDWTIITQYPGTPYFDNSIYVPEKGAWLYTEEKTGNRLWSKQVDYLHDVENYKGIPGEYSAYVWTDTLSPTELVRMRDFAEETTRRALNLPSITHIATKQFEHSMGQGLPLNILRTSNQSSSSA